MCPNSMTMCNDVLVASWPTGQTIQWIPRKPTADPGESNACGPHRRILLKAGMWSKLAHIFPYLLPRLTHGDKGKEENQVNVRNQLRRRLALAETGDYCKLLEEVRHDQEQSKRSPPTNLTMTIVQWRKRPRQQTEGNSKQQRAYTVASDFSHCTTQQPNLLSACVIARIDRACTAGPAVCETKTQPCLH